MDDQTRPTHQVVADRIGVTVATVSRLRSGERLPSLETMLKIKDLTGWNIDAQASSKREGSFHVDLETQLTRWWDSQTDLNPAGA